MRCSGFIVSSRLSLARRSPSLSKPSLTDSLSPLVHSLSLVILFAGGQSHLPCLQRTFISLQFVSSLPNSLYRRRFVSHFLPQAMAVETRHLPPRAHRRHSHRWNPQSSPGICEFSMIFLAPIFYTFRQF